MNNYLKTMLISLLLISTLNLKAQTVYKDVAPIFINNCTSCHRAGGIEFPLTSYTDVVTHKNSIKSNVLSGYMPPWPPDANYRKFTHERLMTAADKTKLISWIDQGTKAGDTTLAPKIPNYTKSALNGKPDLVVKLKKYTSSATNVDHYYCINVPSGITEDRFIRALEFIPGRPDLIHHVVITLDTLGTAVDNLVGDSYNDQGQVGITDYAPGTGPTVFPSMAPAKLGFRLKANTTFSFQIHVPEGTAGEVDSTSEMYIYLYPKGEPNIREMFFETVLQNWTFKIPANSVVDAGAYFPTDAQGRPAPMPINISLFGAWVHSHNTCTSIINYAYKGPDTIPLIKVPKWDFHWQGVYTYPKMIKFPIGYTMYSEHRFDNTINNPNTPDPNQPVNPGLFTKDEMLLDSYSYTFYQPGDENIDIAAILAKDPLFFPTSTTDADPTIIKNSAYPNPFSDAVNIDYTLLSAQYVTVKIFNSLGQEIKKLNTGIQSSGAHQVIWDGSGSSGTRLQPGVYYYQIQAGQKIVANKLMLQ